MDMQLERTRTPKIIEVYVRKTEALGQVAYSGRPLAAAGAVHWCTVKETHQVHSTMSEADEAAIMIAGKIGEEKGIEVRVHDVSKVRSKIAARLKGVKKTPAIVYGNRILEGNLLRERVLSIIQ